MQKQILYPDGTTKLITDQVDTDPANMIAVAIENSADTGAPYVIIGENLEDGPTREVYHIVAAFGVLLVQNVLDPE